MADDLKERVESLEYTVMTLIAMNLFLVGATEEPTTEVKEAMLCVLDHFIQQYRWTDQLRAKQN
jgi:hypothetical protein